MDVSELLLRITLSFVVLFCLARIMGRKEISQLTFFNFISAIAIGSIAATLATSQFLSILNGVIALVGWALFTIAMGYMDIKSKKIRKITTGDPVIVIKDGQIMVNSLRKTRLDINALNSMLRQQNVFEIADVEYAIFETNGKLSVMKKETKKPLTKGDMNIINTNHDVFPIGTEVISDGSVNTNNLAKLHLDKKWLDQQLIQAGVNSVSDVFYAEIQQDGTLHVDKGHIH